MQGYLFRNKIPYKQIHLLFTISAYLFMYCMYNESELGFLYNIKTTRIIVKAEFIRQII